MKANEYKISAEHFVPAKNISLQDKQLKTRPIGYFHDAFNRFKKNKASIVAFIIIAILILFSIITPFCTPYSVSYKDTNFGYCYPKSHLATALKWDFWDGCSSVSVNEFTFECDKAISLETGHNVIKNGKYKVVRKKNLYNQEANYYVYRKDSYFKKGVVYMDLTSEMYNKILDYQDEKKLQIIYPYTEAGLRPTQERYSNDANFWYKTYVSNGRTYIQYDENNNFINIYQANDNTDDYTSKMLIEGESKLYNYAYKSQTGYSVRIDYYEYYKFYHSEIAKDGIKEPVFVLGTTDSGKDILTCVSAGGRFSFLLAFSVAIVNLIIGAFYGAIEGYYGGKIDLVMERIVEILYDVPFIVIVTLLKYHMASSSQILVLFLAFFLTGWIGMAGRTRMQFYRFKNQEYVLAAKTLGASDLRIMFRHIFPNALGTLVTSCVLVIPGMIFTESTLSYLGIINLETGNLTSIGTLLANAKSFMISYPYMMLPPAIFICLLMLSFNLFGNGLRDAFNPSLRNSED